MPESSAPASPAPASLFAARYRLITLGSVVLVFVAAFENLAVTTVMPVISAELDGAALYAAAFAAPLAASVLGMVIAGLWCDATGPRTPLVIAIAFFLAGLVVAGFAPSMEAVVAGRLIQGLGSGGTTVALYVIVARVYPAVMQPRVFGLFSAAWVIPALVGPFVAGVVGETVGWRWVFLGVAILILPAAAMVAPAMKHLRATATEATDRSPWRIGRILWALLLAVAVLALSVSTELDGALVYVLAVVAFAVAILALRPLTPRGTLRAAAGLPSVILTKLLLAGGYFSAEIYLPYLLTSERGLSPAVAGLALTVSGVFWGAASIVQGRLGGRLSSRLSVRLGIVGVVLAVAVVLVTALASLPAWVAIAGWAISGTGMGLAYPRLSVLVLGGSTPENQGFNSAALNIADAGGPAMALAIAGVLFQTLGAAGAPAAFGAVFLLGAVLAASALLTSTRLPR
ncbi:MFS transporter [Herbiconiux solani]|uniref:MFS transporter n=1 Tax=Herbiconiux solani TaxID=661329 RepID=UPI000824759B|nr:MFS transporter [Herbiconiux solani]